MALPHRLEAPAAEPAPADLATPAARSPVAATAASPWVERGDGFAPGGEVGRMHAELAARLANAGARAEPPQERLIRLVSRAGGYGVLAAGYAGVVLLLLR